MTGAGRMAVGACLAAWTAAISAIAPAPARAGSGLGDYVKAARLLYAWRFEDAERAISALARTAPDAPETRYLQAELAFLRGDYERAARRLDGLPDDAAFGNVGPLRALVASTIEATAGFARYESPSGRFVIHYPPGKDEVIVDLAAEVLDRAYDAIGDDLGYEPPTPVRVEILSRASDLAKVSTLTESEIDTTGTIALCKYNKLMIVTPRATVFGYSWMDTLAHEYTHYVVSRASYDTVPVWLQEGLARFEQSRWRSPPTDALSPVEENLLASALASGRLIEFDAMHPSMAKLPSAEAAALAFAEVYTMVTFLHERVGYDGLRRILARQRDGASARRAVTEVTGLGRFSKVESAWRRYLRKRKLSRRPDLTGHTGRARIRKGDPEAPDGDTDNLGVDRVRDAKARNFARLGGILRARHMPKAAAIEYEKALAIAGDDPFIAGKLARTYLELDDADRAAELAAPLVDLDPTDAGPATTLGAAHLRAGRPGPAAEAFERALRIQPFDPTVRCGLAQAYRALGDVGRAERERRACDTLTRTPR